MVDSIFVVTAVVGATELIRRLSKQDWYGALTIVVAALIGFVAGVNGVDGLTAFTGLIAGLTASGLVTVADRVNSHRS